MKNFLPHPAQSLRLEPEPRPYRPDYNEFDIPSEWRIPEGAQLQEFTPEESEQVELDRR